VFYGGANGLGTGAHAPQNFVGPNTGVICCWNGAQFGSTLSTWNFGVTAEADLIVGSPFFTVRSADGRFAISGVGSVVAIYGLPTAGLNVPNMQLWTQATGFLVCTSGPATCPTTTDTARSGNHFGASLY